MGQVFYINWQINLQYLLLRDGKKINLISWNDKEPKYDIRDWDLEHKKKGKGIIFTVDELKKLKDILNSIDL